MPKDLIIIPAYNEASRISGVIASIRGTDTPYDIVVVDDGSGDETAKIASEAGARVLSHPFNLGYGAALQTGYKYALLHGYDLVAQMDADGQHDPAQIALLMAPLKRGEADLVVGSRFLEDTGYAMGLARGSGRRLFRWLSSFAGVRVTDPTSGFQALNRRVLALYCDDFFPSDYPDVDVLLAAHREGVRMNEVPVRMAPSARATTLHGGLKPIYYAYKMMLSMWVNVSRNKRRYDGKP